MESYIGLDAHAGSCTLGIVGPSGKRLGSPVVETNARALIEVLRGIPRNRHVCLEEGTLSGWLHAVRRRVADGEPDYWDHATLLELAVLRRDEEAARGALDDALAAVREIGSRRPRCGTCA